MKLAAQFDQHEELRLWALEKNRLVCDKKGDKISGPTLENMAYNHLVLKEIALSMRDRARLSPDPVDVIHVMVMGWYLRYQKVYEKVPNFNMKSWSFVDSWQLHKMLTRFRPKVLRSEKPRAP